MVNLMRIEAGWQPKVIIDLKPGVYRFNNSSASGKTFLVKRLTRIFPADPRIVLYTYEDYLRGINVYFDDPNKCELLILDRCYLYSHDEKIQEAVKLAPPGAIVIADLKESSGICADHTVSIVRTIGKLEVCL